MTKPSNVEVIVDRMISYMKGLTDEHNKAEIASRCIELAERFAPSNQWFMQVLITRDFLFITFPSQSLHT
jgi:AP-4 complex subunit epsilon-1